jgi:hypothetical protein
MGLLSRFQSRRAAAPTGGDEPLWQRSAFQVAALSEEMQAVHVKGRTPQIIPAFAVEFVEECDEFLPLAAHLVEYAEKHHWDTLQVEALEKMLPALQEGGLLVSTGQLRERLERQTSTQRNESPPISLFGVPTGGRRLGLVDRGLRSFAENFQQYGRKLDVLVADSSRDQAHTAALRDKLRSLQVELGQTLLVAGAEEKRAFCHHLVASGACTREAAEFTLLDPFQIGFTAGSNRNTLLLHSAGRLLASADDDVVCRLTPPPQERSAGVGFYSDADPYARWTYASREEALQAARWQTPDYLALHEAALSRTPGDLIAAETALYFDNAGEEFSTRVLREECRVRATFFGHVGDPGIPTSAFYLYYSDENRERLCQSERHYRASLASRSAFCVAPRMALGDATLSPGMGFALDHRTLLPPCFPVLHAEDYSYSAALWQCCPEALLAHVPWAVLHDPEPGKGILTPQEIQPGRRAAFFEFAHLLRRLMLAEEPPASASAAVRMQSLGRRLADLGALRPSDFRDVLVQHAFREASGRIQFLTEQLEDAPDAPAYWRDDVQHLIEQLTGSMEDTNLDIPLDLQSGRTPEEARALMQRLLSSYGELLLAWPGMVEATIALREKGITLGQPVRG